MIALKFFRIKITAIQIPQSAKISFKNVGKIKTFQTYANTEFVFFFFFEQELHIQGNSRQCSSGRGEKNSKMEIQSLQEAMEMIYLSNIKDILIA